MSIANISYQNILQNHLNTSSSEKNKSDKNNYTFSTDRFSFSNQSRQLAGNFQLTLSKIQNNNIENSLNYSSKELDQTKKNSLEEQELSKNVLELMAQENLTQNELLTSKSFESGASIIIYPSGKESSGKDGIFQASIMDKDGKITTHEITANTVFSDDGNGNVVIKNHINPENSENTIPELATFDLTKSITGSKNDDLIISLTADNINSGDGNDTILYLGKASEKPLNLNLGQGNNTVISLDKNVNMQINAKDGNNSILGANEVNGVFGSGDNVIGANKSSELSFGHGNNELRITQLNDITMGNGDNKIVAEEANRITGGNGNNSLNIDMIKKSIELGNGHNDVMVDALYDVNYAEYYKTFLKDGSTAHLLFPPEKPDGADISLGDGNNTLKVKRTLEDDQELNNNIGKKSNIDLGNGNNLVSLSTVGEHLNLNIGSGNNMLELGFVNGDFNLGNGNNFVRINKADKLEISTGNGHNILDISGNVNEFNYKGQGSSDIIVRGSIATGTINNGKDTSSLNVMGSITNTQVNTPETINLNISGNIINSEINAKTIYMED